MPLDFTVTVAGADTLTVGIARRSAEQIQGEMIQFEITDYSGAGFTTDTDGAYNEELHLAHFWDFDDDYAFVAPVQNATFATATSYTDFNRAGTSRVAKPAHTFRSAGTYNVTVSVWGYVSGVLTERTGSLSVTVGSEAFAGTDTIYVDPAGLYAGKPTGAQEATTISAAVALLSGTSPQRIMLRTGVTHTMTAGVSFTNSQTVHMVSDTPGTRFTIDATSTNFGGGSAVFTRNSSSGSTDFMVRDAEITGRYDPASETHSATKDQGAFVITGTGPQMFLLDNVVMTGLGLGLNSTASTNTGIQGMNDTVITDYMQFGMYDFARDAGIFVGCRLMSAIDCYTDMVGTSFLGEVYRGGGGTMTVFDKCDLFNRVEISNLGREILRVATNGTDSEEVYINQCIFEGVGECIDLGAVNPDTSAQTNSVVANNIFIGGYRTSQLVTVKATGVSLYNNICFVPTSGDREADVFAFLNYENALTGWNAASDQTRPARSFSNTLIALGDGFDPGAEFAAQETRFDTDYSDTLSNNHINHQPGITGGPTVSNLDSTSILTPRYVGRFYAAGPETFASPDPDTTSDDNFATYAPLTGSAAIGAASSGEYSSHDFFGVNRDVRASSHSRSPSDGAIEPDLAA